MAGSAAGAADGSPDGHVPERDSEQAVPSRPATGGPPAQARHPAVPARHAASSARSTARPAAVTQPYLVFDSVLPAVLPSGHVIATYATGPYAVPSADLAGRGPVLWIDVRGTDPAAQVLDVEPGCATPAAAPGWITQRLSASPRALAIMYTSRAEWPLVQAAVAPLPAAMRAQIRWWIADPTGYAHLVPGSDATQWYWGSSYDISTATPRFLARRFISEANHPDRIFTHAPA